MTPLVSVIVPTYRSAETLEACLSSIKKQIYPSIEIIVVDNFSTDATKEIAEKYADLVIVAGPERTTQKNIGIEHARGEYLCFIDADMELAPTVIGSCVQLFQSWKGDIGGICIPETSVGKGFFVAIRAFERSFYTDTSIESARFFKKADVVSVGGFETDIIFFEESLLPQKIEVRLKKSCTYRIDDLIYHHESHMRLNKWLGKKFYYGKSLHLYHKKVSDLGVVSTGHAQINIFHRYAIFLKNPRFYRHPLYALSVLGLKTLEFGSGALGLLATHFPTFHANKKKS